MGDRGNWDTLARGLASKAQKYDVQRDFVLGVLVPSVDERFLEAVYAHDGLGVRHRDMKQTRAALEYVFRNLWRHNVLDMPAWKASLRSYFRAKDDEKLREDMRADGRATSEIVRDVLLCKFVSTVPRDTQSEIESGSMIRALEWTLHTAREVARRTNDNSVISQMDPAYGSEAETRMYLALENAVRKMRRRSVAATEVEARLCEASSALVDIIGRMDDGGGENPMRDVLSATGRNVNARSKRDVQIAIARVLEDVVSVKCSCYRPDSHYRPNPEAHLRDIFQLASAGKTINDPYERQFWSLFNRETARMEQNDNITDLLEKDAVKLLRCSSVKGINYAVNIARIPSIRVLELYLTMCNRLFHTIFSAREMIDRESVDNEFVESLRSKLRHIVEKPATQNLS